MKPSVNVRSPRPALRGRGESCGYFVALLACAIAVALTTTWRGTGVGLVGAVLALIAARPRWSWIRPRLWSVGPFVLLVAVSMWLTQGSESFPTIALISTRIVAVACFVAALASGPEGQVWSHLARLRVPGPLVWLFALAERHARLMAAELSRVRLAWKTRGFRMTASRRSYAVAGSTLGAMMARGLHRSERVAAGLAARGYRGRYPVRPDSASVGANWAMALLGVMAAIGLIVWDR